MEKVKKREKQEVNQGRQLTEPEPKGPSFQRSIASILQNDIFPYFLLFVFCLVYFTVFASHVLWYQEKASLFTFTADLLREGLRQPGGLLVWFEKLLVSFFIFPVAGALILSLIITLTARLSEKALLLSGSRPLKLIPFICGFLLFFLHTDYRFAPVNSLGILMQLVFFASLARPGKGWIALLVSPLVYYLTGGFAWIYILMISVYFAGFEKGRNVLMPALAWLLPALFILLGSEFLFFREIRTLLIFPFTELNPGSHVYLFLAVCAIIALLPVQRHLKAWQIRFLQKNKTAITITTYSLFITIGGALAFLRYDEKTERYFHAEKLFFRRQYKELVAYNTLHRPTNSLTVFLNNIALCETGQLNDRLLDFPQKADGSTLFLKWEMTGEILRRGGYFYYATGMINEAHRWAYENMVINGPTPGDLDLLIRTELVNGNYQMAAKYIALLEKSLFYRKEARQFRKFLYNENAISADRELGEKRKIRLKSDFFSITDDPWINIRRVLDLDSLNRPAFDYNMAWLLLNKQYNLIAEQLPLFQGHGYTKLPVNVEEAVVAMALMNNNVIPDLGGLSVSASTQERWLRYLTVFQKHGSDPRAAEPALAKDFGNTYWYYAFYK